MLSIIIKTFNEQHNIERCLDAVLVALNEVQQPWEILVADSASADRTVELARAYPVTVVQLENAAQRGCGAGVQLGYQHSHGNFVLLLDADMQLLPGFLPVAISRLNQDAGLAGVAGLLQDTVVRNDIDHHRVANAVSSRAATNPRWLSGGGLYRRAAIESCGGYAGNRNLKAWEEAELGLRLTHGGWRLERMSTPAVLHTGHAASTWKLLRAHWRSRRAMAYGVFLRHAMHTPWWPKVLGLMATPLLILVMWSGLAALAIGVALTGASWAALGAYLLICLVGFAGFCIKKHSLLAATSAFIRGHYFAAALVLGLFQHTVSPTLPLPSKVLQQTHPT